jgi:hypothetical protein
MVYFALPKGWDIIPSTKALWGIPQISIMALKSQGIYSKHNILRRPHGR